MATLANYAGIDEKFTDLMATKIVDWVKRGFNAKAQEWYEKSAELGNIDAMLMLNEFYRNGSN